ncbi:MAG: coproporphyrinogen dehydrogenase HemZ [Lachnospiraceae bacterium]|nr:coproporphyrinogen dehydrogenase HemZ [Lachnospiraceae bacterium]
MLTLKINREENEYDLYALVTSFYPEQGIKVVIEDNESVRSDNDEISGDAGSNTIYASLTPEKSDKGFIHFSSGEILEKDATFPFKTDEEDPNAVKRQWKLFLYDSLAEYTGRTLPWGALTGVRPTKLIMGMLGTDEEADSLRQRVKKDLYDKYRVSDKKAELGIEIATLESSILKPFINEDGYSLYIGIPFCPSRCLYCSFTAFPIDAYSGRVRSYLDALKYEMEQMRIYMNGKEPDTVYVGGGTPTSLDEQNLELLLQYIGECVDIKSLKEFTVEAGRPDSITPGKLKVMKNYGVTRISVNPQTMKEETLKLIGRRHTTDDIRRAFGEARDAGFDNINMDMILGLPGETLSDVERSFDEVAAFKPDSITAHSLAVKRASRMKQWIAEHGAIKGLDADKAMLKANETAASLGMKPYYLYRQKNMAGSLENTGFATEGKYGLYNILIMEEVQSIVAIGVGTVSKRVHKDGSGLIERCDTHKDVSLYLSDLEAMVERKRKLFSPKVPAIE